MGQGHAPHAPDRLVLPPTKDVGLVTEAGSAVQGKLVVAENGDQTGFYTIHAATAGDMPLARISGLPNTVRRTPRYIEQDDRGTYQLIMQLGGVGKFEQGGREADLRPGSLILCDLSRPYTFTFPERHLLLAVVIPRDRLVGSGMQLHRYVARAVPTDRGMLRLAGGFFSGLADELSRTTDGFDHHLASALLGVSMGALTGLANEGGGMASPLDRVLAYVEANLSDPTLTSASVARAHHMSVRQLYRLFDGQEEGPGGYIRRRRMERIKADLADPAHMHRSVPAVAARWGVLDAGHVSRMFRKAFGITPTAYRRMLMGAAS